MEFLVSYMIWSIDDWSQWSFSVISSLAMHRVVSKRVYDRRRLDLAQENPVNGREERKLVLLSFGLEHQVHLKRLNSLNNLFKNSWFATHLRRSLRSLQQENVSNLGGTNCFFTHLHLTDSPEVSGHWAFPSRAALWIFQCWRTPRSTCGSSRRSRWW